MDNPRATLSPLEALAGQGVGGDESPVDTTVRFDGTFTLRPGQSLYSPNNKQKLIMQEEDGNLVLYKLNEDGSQGPKVWKSKTDLKGNAGAYAEFQGDGNLVVYGGTPERALWASNTNVTGTDSYGKGILFKLPDVGQMRITVQKTNSDETTNYSPYSPFLDGERFTDHIEIKWYEGMYRKTSLYTNQYITYVNSANIQYVSHKLIMQPNHNLVLYKLNEDGSLGESLWASNTVGTGADRAVFLDTGNLVVYNGGIPKWESGTDLAGTENFGRGSSLQVSGDVLYIAVQNKTDSNLTYDYIAFFRGDKFRCNTATPIRMNGSFTLNAGEAIYSPRRTQKLIMQKDQNLVLYKLKQDGNYESVVWASGTKREECNEVHAWFQADFNLVVYGKDGPLWNSGTDKTGYNEATFNLWDIGEMNIDLFGDGKKTTYSGKTSGKPFNKIDTERGQRL